MRQSTPRTCLMRTCGRRKMSVVTNLVLHLPIQPENDTRLIDAINEFFAQDGITGLVSVDDPRLPRRWYGGSKALECDLFVGAFNHLSLDDFLVHLADAIAHHPWDWRDEPDSIQVFVKEQEDDTFRIIDATELLSMIR